MTRYGRIELKELFVMVSIVMPVSKPTEKLDSDDEHPLLWTQKEISEWETARKKRADSIMDP